MRGKGCCGLLVFGALLAGWCSVGRAGEAAVSDSLPLMISYPRCVEQRLGQVEVSLGTKKRPNQQSAMAPPGVSFREALADLVEAARAKGGTAVIIRHEEALYFDQGRRRARRPMYLSLHGAVVVLDESKRDTCRLELLDPVEFERNALQRTRDNVIKGSRADF